MSKVCQITGKKAQVGNNVSHSKRRTKRKFEVNLHTKKFFWVEQDMWIQLRLSTRALRTINKIGINAALKQAEAAGNLDFKDIKILSLYVRKNSYGKESKRQSRTGDIGVHRTQGKRNAGYVKIYHDKKPQEHHGAS